MAGIRAQTVKRVSGLQIPNPRDRMLAGVPVTSRVLDIDGVATSLRLDAPIRRMLQPSST